MTVAEWVAASRAAQGLPPKIVDPALLARGVAILRDGATKKAAPAGEKPGAAMSEGGNAARRPTP